ncbi:zinc ribbon domain-containing protein [Candidatus Poribacteria bacterium]|nr:zinc ribbon domain-containing protein [Candidatus Poribacteria bacterium]
MPTYDYRCLECETEFEKFQGITEDPIEECPECNGKVKRLIGAGAGLIFKGSGFYITDYRSDGYKESAKKDKNTPSNKSEKKDKNDKKSDNSSDSKKESSASD